MKFMTGGNGPCHPPRKKVAATALTVTILAYSAIKNMAYFILEYSVPNPATSSFSASGRSKGVRLVSATEQIQNRINASGCFQTYQPNKPAWSATIFCRERDSDSMNTATRAKLA